MEYSSGTRIPDPLVEDHPLTAYWNVLTRRWYVPLGTLAAAVIGGVLYFRSLPVQPFPFTTVIEVGSSETPDAARAKIEGAYAPQALAEHALKQGYQESRYAVAVEPTPNSNLLTLHSSGGESSEKDLLGIQQRIVDLLLADHHVQEEILRSSLKSRKFKAEIELQGFQEVDKFFPAKFRRLDERASRLNEQVAQTREFLGDLEQKRAALLAAEVKKTTGQESAVSTFFIIDGDIQRQRDKVRALEEELYTSLKQDREKAEQDQLENKRKQKEQEKLVEDAQLAIDTLKTTKVLFPPQRQLRPSSKASLYSIVGASAILGLLLGVFAAFFLQFAINARRALRRGLP